MVIERTVRMERRREAGEEEGLVMGFSQPIVLSEGCFSWRGGGEALGEKWLTMGFVMGAAGGWVLLYYRCLGWVSLARVGGTTTLVSDSERGTSLGDDASLVYFGEKIVWSKSPC